MITFVISLLTRSSDKKFNMIDIQNATLAGGVAMVFIYLQFSRFINVKPLNINIGHLRKHEYTSDLGYTFRCLFRDGVKFRFFKVIALSRT